MLAFCQNVISKNTIICCANLFASHHAIMTIQHTHQMFKPNSTKFFIRIKKKNKSRRADQKQTSQLQLQLVSYSQLVLAIIFPIEQIIQENIKKKHQKNFKHVVISSYSVTYTFFRFQCIFTRPRVRGHYLYSQTNACRCSGYFI